MKAIGEREPVGLVLAGGAARGAWEAGVLVYLLRHVGPEVGRPFPFQILSGTSIGAFHAARLGAHADDPLGAADALERAWRGLVLEESLRLDRRAVTALALGLFGRGPLGGVGALLDFRPFDRLLRQTVPFERLDSHLASGLVSAVTVSATHVATGRTAVFVARGSSEPLRFGTDPTVVALPVQLRSRHALASAAIPILFPAVSIDGELYCDGGLRQLVPLRPALRLGARSLVVVSPRPAPSSPSSRTADAASARERAFSSPVYLLGKVLDALLLDHVDGDLERLEQVNHILAAGRRSFGPRFEELGQAMGEIVGHELQTITAAVVRPSEDIGRRASELVQSRRFARRACRPAGRLLRLLAEAEGSVETDLVSYLLFDGEHAGRLLELGIADARARHDELCALLAGRRPANRAGLLAPDEAVACEGGGADPESSLDAHFVAG